MKTYPDVDVPTILSARFYTDKIRYESLGGQEFFKENPSGIVSVHNLKPIEIDGQKWQISTIQKYSKKGWIKTDPDCFYQWWTWKLQEYSQNPDGGKSWKSGTEWGPYFRKPNSWRWDPVGTLRDGQLRHFIWTKGYAGLHYD